MGGRSTAKGAASGRPARWGAALTSWLVVYGVLAVIWHVAFDYRWVEVGGFAVVLLVFQAAALWVGERRQRRRSRAARSDE